MRFGRVLFIALGLLAVLAAGSGILWLLDLSGIINIQNALSKIPVVSRMVYQPEEEINKIKKPLAIEKTPAEKQNEKLLKEKDNLLIQITQLKKDFGRLSKQLEVINTEKQALVAERDTLKTTLDSLQNANSGEDAREVSYQKLADYYAEMKPQAAVNIMNNLSDEVVIGILQYLENDQVAKILSAMDPEKAATLVDQMKE